MQLKQICKEILEEAKKNNVNDLNTFNKLKIKVLSRHNYKNIPKNVTIASLASDKDRKKFKNILSMKPVRTGSFCPTFVINVCRHLKKIIKFVLI